MCGIFTAIKLQGYFSEKNFANFTHLTDLVNYRGPDNCGYRALNYKKQLSLSESAEFDIFIGHRRLSIIDLSEAGRQPFTDGEGLWIAYNGEIFNYKELKKELKERGHKFKSDTDTEVILKVYREYGQEGINKLNGMWAFVIVDLFKKQVIVSRDRFSIKPLYFMHNGKEIYFASEIKQLLPLLNKLEINQNVMGAYLKQGLLDYNQETFFCNISKVKSACNMIIDLQNDKIQEREYWRYSEEKIPAKDEDIIEKFRELFIDSVKLRLRSDVPVGCLLSGGLDSSSIAIIANQISCNKVQYFSVISRYKQDTEERFIDIVSSRDNIKVFKLQLDSMDVWDCLKKTIWHNDEPVGGFSAVAQHQIFDLISRHSNIKVVLSGQGGDETLCGYRKFFFFYLSQAAKERQFLEIFKNVLGSLINRTSLLQFSLLDARRYIAAMQDNNMDQLKKIVNINFKLEPIWKAKNVKERQILDIDKYSIPALTHYEDRNSMAYSIESRLPFLDHRLVNFIINVPVSMKIRYGWTKYVLRRAVTELPKEIAWRRDKMGFRTPQKRWIERDFQKEIRDLFKTSRLHELGIINKESLINWLDSPFNKKSLLSHRDIARLTIAEFWGRMFFK